MLRSNVCRGIFVIAYSRKIGVRLHVPLCVFLGIAGLAPGAFVELLTWCLDLEMS